VQPNNPAAPVAATGTLAVPVGKVVVVAAAAVHNTLVVQVMVVQLITNSVVRAC
jgi:hypothetical protein